MKDTKEVLQDHGKRRRAFVRKSAKLAAAAPAIALLLSQTSTPASAFVLSGQYITVHMTVTSGM
jgi:hypothetical protein